MKLTIRTLLLTGLMSSVFMLQPVWAEPTSDDKLRYLETVNWECDDRVAFDGADGGLHDTVSVLKIKFDANWHFTGIFSSSLSYGEGLFNRSYAISGFAVDEEGKTGIYIDGFQVTHKDSLPEGIGWREMDKMVYYIKLDGDVMSLDGAWQDTSGGHGSTVCG